MEVKFGEEFKRLVSTLGETIVLDTYMTGLGSDRYKFESLWNEEKGCLEITLNLTEINIQSFRGTIIVMCTDISGKELCQAFYLEADLSEWCWEKGKNRRDLNYITLYFPVKVEAKIITRVTKANVKFLESKSILLGYNTFVGNDVNSGLDESNKINFLTKNSAIKYANVESLRSCDRSTYINPNGEKVAEVLPRKVYKKLFLSISGVSGSEDENGTITYRLNGKNSYRYVTKALYDLYKVDNGITTLVKKDCLENVIDSLIEGDLDIDYSSNEIQLSSGDIDTILFAKVEYLDEEGNAKVLKSNNIRIITYLNTIVEYTTDLQENGTPLFLFNREKGSVSWNESNTEAKISVYVDLKDPLPRDYVSVIPDKIEYKDIFEFDPRHPIYVSSLRKWKYSIYIKTRQENSSPNWLPFNVSELKSELVKFFIKIGDKEYPEGTFYCVQKGYNPLKIYIDSVLYNEETKKYDGPGVVTITGASIIGHEVGYTKWQAEIVEGDNVALSSMKGDILESPEKSNLTFYLAAGDQGGVNSRVIFRRLNNQYTVDETSWRDLIYCKGDDSWTLINFESVSPKPVKGELFLSCESNYYYGTSDRLIVFPRQGGDKIITVMSETEETPTVVLENGTTLGTYFRTEIKSNPVLTGGRYVSKIRVHANSINGIASLSQYTWQPKLSSTEPTYLTIKTGATMGKVYLAYLPVLNDTLGFYNTSNDLIKDLTFNYSEGRKEKVIQIKSNNTEADEYYPNWYCVSLDSELGITSPNPGVFGNSTIYTDYTPTNPSVTTFSPLVVKRVKGGYSNPLDLLADWENQLVNSSQEKLDISMNGKPASNSIKVMADLDSKLTEVTEDNPIELSYIGIYKLYIKSKDKFRVSISDVSSEGEGLYFFDRDLNLKEENLSTRDYGSFSETSGVEVNLYYDGGTKISFDEEDTYLETKLTVTNLVDGASRSIRFHRTYFNKDNSLNLYSELDAITDNKSSFVIDKNNVLVLNNSRNTSTAYYYKSYVECTLSITPPSYSTISVNSSDQILDLEYGRYGNMRTVNLPSSESVKTRGYLKTDSLLIYNYEQNPEVTFPLKHTLDSKVQSTNLYNTKPNELPGQFKNQYLNYKMYNLPIINPISSPEAVLLESSAQSKKEFNIVVDDYARTIINYRLEGHGIIRSVTLEPKGLETTRDVVVDLKGLPYILTESIVRDPDEVTSTVKIFITAKDDYISEGEEDKPSSKFLEMEIYSSLSPVNLLETPEENKLINEEIVNNISTPQRKTIEFWRLGLGSSVNQFENDDVLVKEFGGSYDFFVKKKASHLKLSYINPVSYIADMKFIDNVIARPMFYGRLERGEASDYSVPILVETDSRGDITSKVTKKLKGVSSTVASNFTLLVGDEALQPGVDTITTRSVRQEGWKYGIKIGDYIYLGLHVNNHISIPVTFDQYNNKYELYVGIVKIDENGILTKDTEHELLIGLPHTSEPSSDNTASKKFGRKYSIEIPKNDSIDKIAEGEFTISDNYGNAVFLDYRVNPKSHITLSLFRDEDMRTPIDGAIYDLSDTTPRNLIFDGSGKLTNSKNIYLKTEGKDIGDSLALIIPKGKDGKYEYSYATGTFVREEQADSIEGKFSVDGIIVKNLPDGTYLYKLNISGEITGINGTSKFPKKPYMMLTRLVVLGLSNSSYVDIPNTKFGSRKVKINPVQTFKSVQYWNDSLTGDINDIISYYPIYNRGFESSGSYNPYVPNYVDPVTGIEYSNKGESDMTNTVTCKIPVERLNDMFNNGFKISVEDREWLCKRNTFTEYTYGANIDLHLEGPDDIHIYYGNKEDSRGLLMKSEDDGRIPGPHLEAISSTGGLMGLSGGYIVYVSNRNGGDIEGKVTVSLQIYGKFYTFKANSVNDRTPICSFTISDGTIVDVLPSPGIELTEKIDTTIRVGFDLIANWVTGDPIGTEVTRYEWSVDNVANDLSRLVTIRNLSTSLSDLLVMLKTSHSQKIYADNLEGDVMPTVRKQLKTHDLRDIKNSRTDKCEFTETLEEASQIKEVGEVIVKGNTPAGLQLHIEGKDFISGEVTVRYQVKVEGYGESTVNFKITKMM